jgi:Mg2+ and Co2+ transporter CorA
MANINLDESFDFGFSIVDEAELEVLQEAQDTITTVSAEAATLEDRLNKLYNMMMPLLNNLAKNPDKNYIFWPNRLAKIEQFRDQLDKVYLNG